MMCRLFGMTSGSKRSRATFWLLEAPDSLSLQSHRDPDGTGLGAFGADGRPEVFKQPIAAFENAAFGREAKEVESTTFVAHVRYATNGADEPRNTHPFEQCGRLFAHNGVIGELGQLESRLGDSLSLVAGDTDSERYFALITRSIDECEGDVGAGITTAVRWISETLPVLSLNFVLVTPTDLWALRYPETHRLYLLERAPGGPHGGRHLDLASTQRTVRVRSADLTEQPAVVVASEPLDENPAWRLLELGELVHVGTDLTVDRSIIVDHQPINRLKPATAAAVR
jgi:glutamine amidotransferase